MASVPDDEPSLAGDSDDLNALVANAPDAAPSAITSDDETIDLKALTALARQEARAEGSAEHAPRTLPGAVSPLVAADPAASEERLRNQVAPLGSKPRSRFGVALGVALGFALGVPAGALLWPGHDAGDHAAVATAPAANSDHAAAPDTAGALSAQAGSVPEQAGSAAPRPAVAASAGGGLAAVASKPVSAASQQLMAATTTPADHASPSAKSPTLAPSTVDRPLGKHAGSASPPTAAPRPVLAVQPAPTATSQPAADAPAPSSAPHTSVDSVLDEALAAPSERAVLQQRREALAAETELPPAPSRDDVSKAMTVLLPAIRGCAMGQSGLATAGIVVSNDGRVASVNVVGAPFQGGASGRCMEGVVRRARFPRFRQPSFRVQFPFAIQ